MLCRYECRISNESYVNIFYHFQTVNMLPHEKFDQFKASIEKLKEMSSSIEPWNCACWSLAPNWPVGVEEVELCQEEEEGSDMESEESIAADVGADEEHLLGEFSDESSFDVNDYLFQQESSQHGDLSQFDGQSDCPIEEGEKSVHDDIAESILSNLLDDGMEDMIADLAQEVLSTDSEMLSECCDWPLLHSAIREQMFEGNVRGVAMGQLVPDPLRTRAGVRAGTHLLSRDDIIKNSLTKCKNVSDFLYKGLSENVYKAKDLEAVENIRTILNLKDLLQQIKTKGAIAIGQTTAQKFLTAASYIDPSIQVKCEMGELRRQYKVFLHRLKDIADIKDSELLSSMDIIIMLLKTDDKRYVGVEAVMDIICQACTYKSVESVVESWISVLEHHSSKQRGLKEESIQTEMMIACNGPPVQHSMSVVEGGMKRYWTKAASVKDRDGHFIRRSENIKSFQVSKAVDGIMDDNNTDPIMK